MPEAGSEKETSREKEGESRLGEVTPIAGGLHQGPVGPKGRWSKKRKAEGSGPRRLHGPLHFAVKSRTCPKKLLLHTMEQNEREVRS